MITVIIRFDVVNFSSVIVFSAIAWNFKAKFYWHN